ncbi:MAG: hypothetical protein KC613_26660, partial [Myxococcales bacterium]|nr:hypothetical protein [Myxococcales bacterium]
PCERACGTVVECLSDTCNGTPLDDFSQCVRACESGELNRDALQGATCGELTTFACSGEFAGACDCSAALCEQACQHIVDCAAPLCDEPVIDLAMCVQACTSDQLGFQPELALATSCDTLQTNLCRQAAAQCRGCQRDPGEFNLGAACDNDGECQAGDLQAVCYPETDPGSGNPTGFVGGYCMGFGCGQPESCGPDGICVQTDEEGNTACLAACSAAGDCRGGYECLDISMGMGVSVCFPAQ